MTILIDSATVASPGDANSDSSQWTGQSFEVQNSAELDSLKIYMRKNGSPTGSFQFEIYEHSGTYGTSSLPTGSPLATSDSFNTTSLTSSYAEYTINFSGANRISMTAGERYVLVCNYANTTYPNSVYLYSKTPSYHSGNRSYKTGGTWYALSAWDVSFDLQGVAGATATFIPKISMF